MEATEFLGTTVEVEAWLRDFFDWQRAYLSISADDEDVRSDHLDKFERSVWEVSIRPTDQLSGQRCRDTWRNTAGRIRSERETLEMLGELYGRSE